MNFTNGKLTLECGGEKILFNLYGMMYAPSNIFQAENLDNDEFEEVLQDFEDSLRSQEDELKIFTNFE